MEVNAQRKEIASVLKYDGVIAKNRERLEKIAPDPDQPVEQRRLNLPSRARSSLSCGFLRVESELEFEVSDSGIGMR